MALKFKWAKQFFELLIFDIIFSVLIHDLKTAWHTKIQMPFLSSLQNLL